MTRETNFNRATHEALRIFGDPTPTVPRGLSVQASPAVLRGLQLPRPPLVDELLALNPVRRPLRPTWWAVAAAGTVGTLAGVLIAVLSAPVVF